MQKSLHCIFHWFGVEFSEFKSFSFRLLVTFSLPFHFPLLEKEKNEIIDSDFFFC